MHRARGSATGLADVSDCVQKDRVLEKGAVLDRLVDPEDVLLDDPARSQVQVADLAVPHLPVGQADRLSRCVETSAGEPLPEAVEDGGPGERDRVSLALVA